MKKYSRLYFSPEFILYCSPKELLKKHISKDRRVSYRKKLDDNHSNKYLVATGGIFNISMTLSTFSEHFIKKKEELSSTAHSIRVLLELRFS